MSPQAELPLWRALQERGKPHHLPLLAQQLHQVRCLRVALAFNVDRAGLLSWYVKSTRIFSFCAGIRLAGATNDVHIYDVRSGHWGKIQPLGEPPSPRAAHAAAAVGNMVVIQVCAWVCLLP